jgi:hypothetical protein
VGETVVTGFFLSRRFVVWRSGSNGWLPVQPRPAFWGRIREAPEHGSLVSGAWGPPAIDPAGVALFALLLLALAYAIGLWVAGLLLLVLLATWLSPVQPLRRVLLARDRPVVARWLREAAAAKSHAA